MIVWRNSPEGVEVLMGRRSRRAAFVPDFFVFPGGRIDTSDHDVRAATPLDPTAVTRMGVRRNASLAEAVAVAAVRELFEETGLVLAERGDVGALAHEGWAHWRVRGVAPALHHLGYFGRAITSPISPIRFHARFFVAPADVMRGELAGSGELSDLAFYPVTEVLAHMPVVDVTEFMLHRIASYAAAPCHFDARTPVFSYRDATAFVRYQ